MSVEVRADFEGLTEIEDRLQRLDASIKAQVQQNLTELAHSIENMARQLAPIKTGHLRSSIYAQIHDWMVKVGAQASYAAYLEFGTRRIQARRFLNGAFEAHLSQLAGTLDDAVRTAIGEVSGR